MKRLTAELPLFRSSIIPRALTRKKLQQPSSRASTLLAGCSRAFNTHNKCTGVCRFVRGIPVGTATVARTCGISVGPAEALTQPRPTDPVAQLPDADDHFRVTQRNQSGPPARGNSAHIAEYERCNLARAAWVLARRSSASARTRPFGGSRHRGGDLAARPPRHRLTVLLGRPAPWAQVCSLVGVMMSAAEKSAANCSGVPNIAAMRSVYLTR